MDLFDKESGSLYLTYDRFHNILHASREGEGTDGFLRHIHDDVSLILQEGHDPNVWFTYFEFPDKRDIPNLALKDMSLFFEKTTRAAERSNARCRYTVNAADVIYCFKNGIVPLTPQAEKSVLCQQENYPLPTDGFGNNTPQTNVALPEYRSYMAVETEKGVVLFTNTSEGLRQRKAYEKYLELNFFNPSQLGGKFRYWEIIASPFDLKDKVDCLSNLNSQSKDDLFHEAYVDPAILKQGHSIREFDLTQSFENYTIFCKRTDPNKTPYKDLGDMTLKELYQFFTSMLRGKEKGVVCTESLGFPSNPQNKTFKIKR